MRVTSRLIKLVPVLFVLSMGFAMAGTVTVPPVAGGIVHADGNTWG